METQTSRNSLNEIVGLLMPLTRIKGIMDQQGLNHEEQVELYRLKEAKKELRKRGKVPESEDYAKFESEAYKAAEAAFKQWKANNDSMKKADEATITALETENAALAATPGTQILIDIQTQTQHKTRISKEASVALGCCLQKIIEDLRDFAVTEAKKSGSKIIHPHVCFATDRVATLKYSCFIDRLGSWNDARERFFNHEDWEYEKNAKVKELKAQAKAEGIAWKEAKELPKYKDQILAEPEITAYVPTYGANTKMTFSHYAEKIFKELRREPTAEKPNAAYRADCKNIKFGQDFKTFASNLVMDFLEKVNPLIEISLRCRKIKTVTEDVIKDILEMMAVIDNSEDILADLFAFIDNKMAVYRESEKVKKEAKVARDVAAPEADAPAPAAVEKVKTPATATATATAPIVEAPAPGDANNTQNRPARRRRRAH